MPSGKAKSPLARAEAVYDQLEQDLDPGELRDLWLLLRQELSDGGLEAVTTYLDAEFEHLERDFKNALIELDSQLEGTT